VNGDERDAAASEIDLEIRERQGHWMGRLAAYADDHPE
jgi:hypothetical protein